jgi:ComF family protein
MKSSPKSSSTPLLPLALKGVLNAVLPPRCAGCGLWDDGLFCSHCENALRPIVPPYCARCGIAFDAAAQVTKDSVCAGCRSNRYHRAPQFARLRSLYHFEGPIREAVHHFKYHDKTALARPLAGLMADYLRDAPASGAPEPIPLAEIRLLVPIPLHPWRRWRRGYNQSALLTQELATLLALPTASLLARRRHTMPQIDLPADARVQNVKDAFIFQATGSALPRGPVLLVDDVCTTGATIDECARVLRRAGFEEIYGLTLARRD